MAKRIGSLFGVLLIVLAPGVSSAQTAADCDFDGSGKVDFLDFLAFATASTRSSEWVGAASWLQNRSAALGVKQPPGGCEARAHAFRKSRETA